MTRVAVIGIPGAWSSEALADAVAARTGERWLVDARELVLDLPAGTVRSKGRNLTGLDGVIVKKLGLKYSPGLLDVLETLRFLEGTGVRVFSSPGRLARVLDRLSCTVDLALAGLPLPETVVTGDLAEAQAAVDRFGKAVLKPLFSTKARGMELVEAGSDAAGLLEAFHRRHPTLYVQKLVEDPGWDLGVSFVGGEYLASYARVRTGGAWNTTARCGGRYEPAQPAPEVLALAQRAQEVFGLDFAGVDVVLTPEGPRLYEVSAFGGFRGLREAHGIDAAARLADYVLTRPAR